MSNVEHTQSISKHTCNNDEVFKLFFLLDVVIQFLIVRLNTRFPYLNHFNKFDEFLQIILFSKRFNLFYKLILKKRASKDILHYLHFTLYRFINLQTKMHMHKIIFMKIMHK